MYDDFFKIEKSNAGLCFNVSFKFTLSHTGRNKIESAHILNVKPPSINKVPLQLYIFTKKSMRNGNATSPRLCPESNVNYMRKFLREWIHFQGSQICRTYFVSLPKMVYSRGKAFAPFPFRVKYFFGTSVKITFPSSRKHAYIVFLTPVKLGFTVCKSRRGASNEYPQSMF